MNTTIKRFSNLFITHNGQKIITSVAIADYFGKQHKSVLKAIRNLLSEMPDPEFGKLNFMPGSYLDEQNKQQPQYCLTRNGATLLAMGFTGKNATELCLSLLQEFKAMNKQVAALAEPRDEFGFPVNVKLLGQYPSRTCHAAACRVCSGELPPSQPSIAATSPAQQAHADQDQPASLMTATSSQDSLHQAHAVPQAQLLSTSQLALKLESDLRLAANAVANLQATLGLLSQSRCS